MAASRHGSAVRLALLQEHISGMASDEDDGAIRGEKRSDES
jgi:hypothetical protein